MNYQDNRLEQALERLRALEAELASTKEKLSTLTRWQAVAKDELRKSQIKLATYERWVSEQTKKPTEVVREVWVAAATAAALTGYSVKSLAAARRQGHLPREAYRRVTSRKYLYNARILQTLDL